MPATIEQRLQRLEDEREIQRTLYSYGHALDSGDEAAFLDCWIETGQLVWPAAGTMTGHAQIGRAFRAHTHAPAFLHKHLVIAPMIEIDGDRCEVESMYLRIDPIETKPQVTAFGRYRDALVRCADGRWRFERRTAESEGRWYGGLPVVTAATVAP